VRYGVAVVFVRVVIAGILLVALGQPVRAGGA
jgi:hypothetical protein